VHGFVVEDEAKRTLRVDRRVYLDAAIFEQEQRAIFNRCWLYAAHASELANPGDFVTRTIAGRSLIVARGNDGELRALRNTCAHRGTMVCKEARGNTRAFQCPYHAWTYDTRGRLRGLPGREGYGDRFVIDEIGLEQVRLESYRDFLFVTFATDASSLVDYLAGAAEYLDLVIDQSFGRGMEVVPGTQLYGIAANWKMLAENSIDTYHVVSLHRRYLDYVADQGVRQEPPVGRTYELGNGHAVADYSPPSVKPVAFWGPPMPASHRPVVAALQRRLAEMYGDDRARRIGQTYRQLLIFPNLVVNDTCATTVRSFQPVGHDRMHVTAWALVPRDQSADDRALTLSSYLTFFGPGGFATPDDIEILESCQRVFASGEQRWSDCSRGMHRPESRYDDELQVRAFWRRWQELMR
jgi:phenylpropionate dioxygenase-like ring-hydroxylating dioxygenase large terminal subunit